MIYRHSDRQSFVIMDKATVNDPRLSWRAKGILIYLLGKPNDWQVYESDIVKHATDGRDSVRAGIHELIRYGYLIREQDRDNVGKFAGYNYDVYETPTTITENGISVNGTANGKPDNGYPVNGPKGDISTNDEESVDSTENGYSVNGFTDVGKPVPTNNDITNYRQQQHDVDDVDKSYKLLTEIGVSDTRARWIAKTKPQQQIEMAVKAAHADTVKNKAGYVIQALKEDWVFDNQSQAGANRSNRLAEQTRAEKQRIAEWRQAADTEVNYYTKLLSQLKQAE